MWTDGAHNAVTNFALNSELEGDKCCVKAGGRGWRGEKCGEFVIVTVRVYGSFTLTLSRWNSLWSVSIQRGQDKCSLGATCRDNPGSWQSTSLTGHV